MSHAKYGSTIQEFVRRLREDQGLTQNSLSKLLGVSEQYVWNIENKRGAKVPMSFAMRLMTLIDEPRKAHLKEILVELSAEISMAKVLAKMEEKSVRKPKTAAKKPNKR